MSTEQLSDQKISRSYFTVTSKVLDNCFASFVEHPLNEEPYIDARFHKLGQVNIYSDEEAAKNALKRHFLEATEVDLLAKTYAVESDKLEGQLIRFNLRFLDKKNPENQLEIARLNGLLKDKKENTNKLKQEIRVLRHYRNSKVELEER